MKKTLLQFILLLLMGAVFLLVGVHELSGRLNLVKNGLKAEGTVVNLKKHLSRRKVLYHPVIEFKTSTGQVLTIEYSTGSNPPKYSIGQKVNIFYSKQNPKNAVIDTKSEVFGLALIFISIGAVLLLLDVFIVIKKHKAALSPAL